MRGTGTDAVTRCPVGSSRTREPWRIWAQPSTPHRDFRWLPPHDADQQRPFLKAPSASSLMCSFLWEPLPPSVKRPRTFLGGLSLVTLFFSETSLFHLHGLGEDLSTLILKEILEQSVWE